MSDDDEVRPMPRCREGETLAWEASGGHADAAARVYRLPDGAPEIPLVHTVRARRPPVGAGGRER